MEFRSLKCFVWVAELGSISRAAKELAIVQPALSRHIQRLEEELGVTLFTRLPRGVQLTTSGRQFLEYARSILRQLEDAKREVSTSAARLRRQVVLGLPGSLTPVVIPGCLERFQRDLPEVWVRVVEGSSTLLYDRLLSGHLDVAVLSNPQSTKLLRVDPLFAEPIVVLTPPDPSGSKRVYTMAEVIGIPLWLTTGLRRILDEQFGRFGKKTLVASEIDSIETIRRLLLRGSGVTMMPVSIFRDDIESGRLSAFPVIDVSLHRLVVLARTGSGKGSTTIDHVAAFLKQEATALTNRGAFSVLPGMQYAPAHHG